MEFIKKILRALGIIKDKIEEEIQESIEEISDVIEEELFKMTKTELKKKVRELGLDKDIDLRQSKEDIAKAVSKLK